MSDELPRDYSYKREGDILTIFDQKGTVWRTFTISPPRPLTDEEMAQPYMTQSDMEGPVEAWQAKVDAWYAQKATP